MRQRRWKVGATDTEAGRSDQLEQAAAWHARLTESVASEALRAEFDRWREADCANAAAYERIAAACRLVRDLADSSPMLALRHETLARIVVPGHRARFRPAIAAGLATLLTCSAALLVGQLPSFDQAPTKPAVLAVPAPRVYRTALGERMTIALVDGSTAALNTSSRLRVEYSSSERRLVLEAGQALFEVAKGQSRRFSVIVGDRTVTAHGTTFDVRLDKAKIEVALIEGQVTVGRNGGLGDRPTRMTSNDVLVAAGATSRVRKVGDARQIVSWRDGLVLFDNDRLADAISELNRYVSDPIVLGDSRLAGLRVSGVFKTGETMPFVEALELGFAVRAERNGQGQIVLRSSV